MINKTQHRKYYLDVPTYTLPLVQVLYHSLSRLLLLKILSRHSHSYPPEGILTGDKAMSIRSKHSHAMPPSTQHTNDFNENDNFEVLVRLIIVMITEFVFGLRKKIARTSPQESQLHLREETFFFSVSTLMPSQKVKALYICWLSENIFIY